MPVTDIIRRPCGLRYHEAADGGATVQCECGTFAIGTCADCGKPVCGDHSDLHQNRRLCVQDIHTREEAAAFSAAKARLTPEKFLALAAAAGNPGLRTWTIVQLGTKKTMRREGLFGTRSVAHTHVGRVGQYEIRGWVLPCYVPASQGSAESPIRHLTGFDGLMLTAQGSFNKLNDNIIPSVNEVLPTFENTEELTEGHIKFGYDLSNRFRRPGYFEEALDLALRELCRNLRIPV